MITRLYYYFTYSKNKNLENDEEIPDHFNCPITHCIMEDPIILDNKTFDHEAILEWLKISNKNPFTNLEFKNKTIIPNIELKEKIIQYKIIKYKYNIFQRLYITNSRFKYCVDTINKWLQISLHILFQIFIKSSLDILVFIIISYIRIYFNLPKYTFNIYNIYNNGPSQMSIDFAISKFSAIMIFSMIDNYFDDEYYKRYYKINHYITNFIMEHISSFVFTYSRASIKYYFKI